MKPTRVLYGAASLMLASAVVFAGQADVAKITKLRNPDALKEQAPATFKANLDTSKGLIVIDVHRDWAPNGADRFYNLVKNGFYDGQRIHRALPGFLVQWGDPQSRDLAREADWGRGAGASSGHPIGASELRRKRLHTRGAVAMAHQGNPALADSQIYVTLADRPDLDNRYTVFGHVVSGDDVPSRLERGDLIRKMYVKE